MDEHSKLIYLKLLENEIQKIKAELNNKKASPNEAKKRKSDEVTAKDHISTGAAKISEEIVECNVII